MCWRGRALLAPSLEEEALALTIFLALPQPSCSDTCRNQLWGFPSTVPAPLALSKHSPADLHHGTCPPCRWPSQGTSAVAGRGRAGSAQQHTSSTSICIADTWPEGWPQPPGHLQQSQLSHNREMHAAYKWTPWNAWLPWPGGVALLGTTGCLISKATAFKIRRHSWYT